MQLIGLGHETHYHERRSQTLKLGYGALTQMLERYRGKLGKDISNSTALLGTRVAMTR